LQRLGHTTAAAGVQRFPRNASTRKGNLAEIVLAEYIVATSHAGLPVYRLRYNPNVDQSMKGDDVLAFDLDSEPVRIVIGEAKFRGTSTKAAVDEMIAGLVRSNRTGLPASLAFVGERLYDAGQHELADRVMHCVILFSEDRLQLDYVGLLMSDAQSEARVNRHTPTDLRRLAVISLGLAQQMHWWIPVTKVWAIDMVMPLEKARDLARALNTGRQRNLAAQTHAKHVLQEVREELSNFPQFDAHLDEKITLNAYAMLASGCSLIEQQAVEDGAAALEQAATWLHEVHSHQLTAEPSSRFHQLLAAMAFYAAGHYSRAFV
jgi:hypothetical protein